MDSTGFLKTGVNRIRSATDDAGDSNYGHNAALLQLSNLAGGTYSVTAKIEVNNDSASAENVTCQLIREPGQVVLDQTLQTLGGLGGAAQTLQFAFTAETPASASETNDGPPLHELRRQ